MTFLLRFWKPLAGAALILALLGYVHYRDAQTFQRGYDKAKHEADVAVAIQEKQDAKQIADAYADRNKARDELAAIRARPVPHLMCRRAPSPMPKARLSDPEAANPGALPDGTRESSESFDPVPALIVMADEADSLLADCRMLHQAVHGFPSAP